MDLRSAQLTVQGRVAPTATVLSLPGGRELAFAEYGDRSGEPIIAFHGTPGSRLQLAPIAEIARATGVRLIVPDRPGYGHSEYMPHRRLLDWPADVSAVGDHLGLDRFAVLGVSGGGPHALACAFAIPDRLTRVATVSSPSPRGWAASEGRRAQRERRLAGVHGLLWPVAAVLVGMLRHFPRTMLAAADRWMPEADRSVAMQPGYQAWFLETARRTSKTTPKAAAQDVELFARPWGFHLGEITAAVDVWHGEDDRLVDASHARVLAASIPSADLHECMSEGHLLFADNAKEVLNVLACRR